MYAIFLQVLASFLTDILVVLEDTNVRYLFAVLMVTFSRAVGSGLDWSRQAQLWIPFLCDR